MPFSQVTVSGNVVLANAVPAANALLTFTLNTAITDGSQYVNPETLPVRCDPSGHFSIALNANDDASTLPIGTYYTVVGIYADLQLFSFKVIIPSAASGSGVNLFSLVTLSNPTVQTPYVISVNGQHGVVTVSGMTLGGSVTGASPSVLMATDGNGHLANGPAVKSVVTGTSVTKTSAYTLTAADSTVYADATSAAFALTLPTAVGFTGEYAICAIASNTQLVSLNTTSAQTISGYASGALTLGTQASGAPYQSITLRSDGANWRVI